MYSRKKPYVVSQDIDILLTQWAKEYGFKIPDDNFFLDLRYNFTHMMTQLFPHFIYLQANKLKESMQEIIEKGKIETLSLDQIYFSSDLNLSLTRTVDEDLQDLGIGQRSNALALEQQLDKIMSTGVKKLALVDDVIFTGGLLSEVRSKLENMGIQIPVVYTYIGVGMGVERLRAEGMQVQCANYYPQVIDQVCERDFFLGVPNCGRTLVDVNGNIWGVPYMLPFGDPKWASIPEIAQSRYSRFCIKQSIKLWQAIEIASGKPVLCQDLSRSIIGFPVNNERFVDVLHEHL
jgi:hypothetical protein